MDAFTLISLGFLGILIVIGQNCAEVGKSFRSSETDESELATIFPVYACSSSILRVWSGVHMTFDQKGKREGTSFPTIRPTSPPQRPICSTQSNVTGAACFCY
ncbi:hypothetical protein ACN38_g10769 [Penicillium nordicum]|uniref:Amino acid permease/ SLC12A domain-containing protein n=1 Tax=Penicillium nordicum TaxID=229535 RepID=A0A0M8P101_9EURO|nr:hypothetical protein ACN38_g10769 [Penicillium nordicum]